MGLQIRKAQRSKAWLKLVIDGVSGSGKTYSALQISRGIGPEPRVLLIDTENGSGELYSHLYEYEYIRLEPPFSPAKYVDAISAAVHNGNDVVIVDSLSHCWKYILSYKESLDAANPKASWTNWAKAKALFDEMKNALLQCPAHVVATLRAGSEYAESYDAKGNKTYTKVGTKPIAEPDLEFEFTLALRIERSHLAVATKDRTEQFDIAAPFTPSVSTGRKLYDWLMAGAGELSHTWGGALHSEDAQRALSEAARLGIGAEGATEDELARKAAEMLAQKRREANATIKELRLDEDKEGLKTFSEKAKGAGLDPLELFWEFSKKRDGLKTWNEFQVILDECINVKNRAEAVGGKSDSSATDSEKSPVSEASANSNGEQRTCCEGENDLLRVSDKSAAIGKARKPSSGRSAHISEAEEQLMAAVNLKAVVDKSPDKETILRQAAKLGVILDDLIRDVVAANPKARLIDVFAALDEADTRGR